MKKIIAILSLILTTSCTPVLISMLDVTANKMSLNKDIMYKMVLLGNKYSDFGYIGPNYNYQYYKYKSTLFYRIYKEESKNALIYIHGGAFISHDIFPQYYTMLKSILNNNYNDFEIILVDIKGEKYPSQNQELDEIIQYAQKKYSKYVIAGDSSGGNVVLSTALKRKDENKKISDAIILFSPWTDLTNTVPSRKKNFKRDILLANSGYPTLLMDNPYVKGENLKDPYISPIFGEYKGFPKTLIQHGTEEILSDDSVIVYEKMRDAGVDVSIESYKDSYHVFQLFGDLEQTQIALKSVNSFLEGVFNDKGIDNK